MRDVTRNGIPHFLSQKNQNKVQSIEYRAQLPCGLILLMVSCGAAAVRITRHRRNLRSVTLTQRRKVSSVNVRLSFP